MLGGKQVDMLSNGLVCWKSDSRCRHLKREDPRGGVRGLLDDI